MDVELYCPGLRGVVVGETEIARLDGGLQYRGYAIGDLIEHASFIETAYLLLHDELPSPEQLADFRSILQEEAHLPPQAAWLLEQLPLHVAPLEAMRTGVSLLAHFDSQPTDDIATAGIAQAIRLMARVPLLIAALQQARHSPSIAAFDEEVGYVANLLQIVTGRPATILTERALRAVLISAAEQEFNPSTFAARVVASTGADLYSAVLAGMATLSGRLSGGGDPSCLSILSAVGAADRAAAWVSSLTDDECVPGFGHPVYRSSDPRADALAPYCRELAESIGQTAVEDLADAITHEMLTQRRTCANIDWTMSRLLHYLGVPADIHVLVFLCARLVGWCAHAMEQRLDGELYRPRARYRGAEDCVYVPLAGRT